MLTRYKFLINGTEVYPVYGNNLSKDSEQEQNEIFHRDKLSQGLTFYGGDFELINSANFDTEFLLDIHYTVDGGLTWDVNYWHGVFYKTDCDVNIDDRQIKVTPEVLDDYTDILNNKDNEYNILKLKVKKTPIQLTKRPMLQIYPLGGSTIYNYINGTGWEQSVDNVESEAGKMSDYYFKHNLTVHRINVYHPDKNFKTNNFEGDYLNHTKDKFTNNVYFYDRTFRGRGNTNVIEFTRWNQARYAYFKFEIKRVSDSALLYESDDTIMLLNSYVPTEQKIALHPQPASGEAEDLELLWTYQEYYARFLLDVHTYEGVATKVLPANDIVENIRNYDYALEYEINTGLIYATADATDEDSTIYGQAEDGYYFVEPDILFKARPFIRNEWHGYSSVWFYDHNLNNIPIREVDFNGRRMYTMSEGIHISDAIRVLLDQFAPNILHEATADYSQFLYGDENPVSSTAFKVFITQKSNILAGSFDAVAQKSELKFSTLMSMLKQAFKCYWFVEDGKLKVEHISYFKNNRSYTKQLTADVDLTKILDKRLTKSYANLTNKYTYDKLDLTSRYEFKWMDGTTDVMEGHPIEVESKLVQKDKKSDIRVTDFNPDVDMMLANPTSISRDGFALLSVVSGNPIPTGIIINGYVSTSNLFLLDPGYTALWFTLNGFQGVSLTISGFIRYSAFAVAYFDKDVVFISGQYPGSDDITTVLASARLTVPDNAVYMCVANYQVDVPPTINLNPSQYVPFTNVEYEGVTLSVQNGMFSWVNIHENFWCYDLAFDSAVINKVTRDTYYPIKAKEQKITIPSIIDIDPLKAIKTGLGIGIIRKISVNLSNRVHSITLRYNND